MSDKVNPNVQANEKKKRKRKYATYEDYLLARKEKTKEWKQRNAERQKEYHKNYYQENRESMLEQNKLNQHKKTKKYKKSQEAINEAEAEAEPMSISE